MLPMQGLGEILVEGQSGGRLLGCSPNVGRLLHGRMRRPAAGMRVDMLCDLSAAQASSSSSTSSNASGAFDKRGVAYEGDTLRRTLGLTAAERAFSDRLQVRSCANYACSKWL
eukprot:SAG31_NODE_14276_length_817_cov_1.005571_1_plen_113_part_00